MFGKVSRSGAIPGPTVTVRMRESGIPSIGGAVLRLAGRSPCALILALMRNPMNQRSSNSNAMTKEAGAGRVAFIQSCWHKDIVDRCRVGFLAEFGRLGLAEELVELFEVPGAFEIPLQAKL